MFEGIMVEKKTTTSTAAKKATQPKTVSKKTTTSVDMAAPGTGQTSSEFKCTVCVKDSSGPYDKMMSEKFIKLARKNDIPYAIDIYPYYGSDASAVLRAGWNVRAALIGPGVDASHSFERTHKEAVDATFKLALAYLLED